VATFERLDSGYGSELKGSDQLDTGFGETVLLDYQGGNEGIKRSERRM